MSAPASGAFSEPIRLRTAGLPPHACRAFGFFPCSSPLLHIRQLIGVTGSDRHPVFTDLGCPSPICIWGTAAIGIATLVPPRRAARICLSLPQPDTTPSKPTPATETQKLRSERGVALVAWGTSRLRFRLTPDAGNWSYVEVQGVDGPTGMMADCLSSHWPRCAHRRVIGSQTPQLITFPLALLCLEKISFSFSPSLFHHLFGRAAGLQSWHSGSCFFSFMPFLSLYILLHLIGQEPMSI